MRQPTPRLAVATVVAVAATLVPLAIASLPATGASPRTTTVTCPETHLPASPANNVWVKSSYQSGLSPNTLAEQVVACEDKFHAKTSVLAEVALIGLNETPSKSYQNQNMWLANNKGTLTAQNDFKTLGIPALSLEDGPDGIIYRPTKGARPTVFPNEMALASSMNPALATLYGEALSAQASELHFMGVQAPDLNLDRIPNWGRVMETFGEDPVLAGEMGAAEAIGILKNSPIVVLKHFGIYGQETSRRSINWNVSTSALYNTYLRSFAVATTGIATSAAVSAHREVALMCSYGNINGVRSCGSQALESAEDTLDFSGLVRSDLDTVTTSPALLRAGVSLIKPLDAQEFESTVSPANKLLIRDAALKVLTTMFAADLVSSSELTTSSSLGTLTTTEANNGQGIADEVEADGAVLLKDGTPGGEGDLPLSSTNGSVAVIAASEMSTTCKSLAQYLVRHHVDATCTVWDNPPTTTTVLLHNLAHGSNAHPLSKTVTWIAPTTGPYVVNNQTYGDSTVSLNGKTLMAQPGIAEIYGPNDVTLDAVKGRHYIFKEVWEALGPYLTIAGIAGHVTVGVEAAIHAKSALILADDYTAEGADLDELGLPEGQDALISAVEARVPTSVALFTTGPVVMPWLTSQTKSLIEMWNPGGNPPFGLNFSNLVPAYGVLLTGAVSPQGHLPITFPANQSDSPLDLGTGSREYAYWPGNDGNSNLDLAPLDGEVIGYGWYEEAGWPVLFPFGYGLSYATMTQTFNTSTTACQPEDSPTAICLPVAVRLKLPDKVQAVDAVQIYVAQPQSTGDPAPQLVLGSAQAVECRSSGTAGTLTGACASPAHTDLTITSTDVGQWDVTSQSYEFTDGCYAFIVAPNASVAYQALAAPNSPTFAGDVVHATYPFSPSTTLSSGACPG